ncbi:MAG: hypothetical protein R3E56_11935 [Burkholderiaceae bacterium]
MTNNEDEPVREARRWTDGDWTAQVIKNEDDDGWAVAMFLDGEPEPALVGPWIMGRDKKNPKPLDISAFNTLVKTAKEVIRRSEQQLHAQLNRDLTIEVAGERVRIAMAILPDEEGATATLSAYDASDDLIARVPVPPTFKLGRDAAERWAVAGYGRMADTGHFQDSAGGQRVRAWE